MRRNPAIQQLIATGLFSNCSRADIARIARLTTPARIAAGTHVVEQWQTGRECFIILSGHGRVERDGQTVATCGPGDIIGELAMLDRLPRSATVVAHTDVEALVLGSREFAALLHIPAVARKLTRLLARRLRDSQELVWGGRPSALAS